MTIEPYTYDYYNKVLGELATQKFVSTFYDEVSENDKEKKILLRHDVDFRPEKAIELAKIEEKYGFRSTFFILVKSNFYNPFWNKTSTIIKSIIRRGHKIGLHFDSSNYQRGKSNLSEQIKNEIVLLKKISGGVSNVVAFHRPRKYGIPAINNDEIVETNCEKFREFHYLSDSRKKKK